MQQVLPLNCMGCEAQTTTPTRESVIRWTMRQNDLKGPAEVGQSFPAGTSTFGSHGEAEAADRGRAEAVVTERGRKVSQK